MVDWYKHDIPAWMDGTAGLSDGAYRAYHVICQMIYLAEEPIAINERYLAGACNQSVRAFRSAFSELTGSQKLTVIGSKIDNSRAAAELFRIEKNRENAGKGGEKSGKVRKSQEKTNKNKEEHEATLKQDRSLLEETRLDQSRVETADPTGSSPRKRSKLKSGILTETPPSTIQLRYAMESGYSAAEAESMFVAFKNNHIAKGNLMADWDAAWRTWVNNQLKWHPRPAAQKTLGAYGDDWA